MMNTDEDITDELNGDKNGKKGYDMRYYCKHNALGWIGLTSSVSAVGMKYVSSKHTLGPIKIRKTHLPSWLLTLLKSNLIAKKKFR